MTRRSWKKYKHKRQGQASGLPSGNAHRRQRSQLDFDIITERWYPCSYLIELEARRKTEADAAKVSLCQGSGNTQQSGVVNFLSHRERLGRSTKKGLEEATSFILSKKAEKKLYWSPASEMHGEVSDANEVVCAESLLGTLTRKSNKKKRR